MWYRYNAAGFLKIPHERHPIPRPFGELIIVNYNSGLCSVPVSTVMYVILPVCYFGQCYNGTWLYWLLTHWGFGNLIIIIPPPNEVGGGGILDSPCPSVRPSVRPSVCRRHGFRSISQVCLGISISNFICMLMVAISRSLLIFSDVTSKMAAWRPYWIFWFPDSNFTLALNINFKLMRHNTYVYG